MSYRPMSRLDLAFIAFVILVGFNWSLASALHLPWDLPIILWAEAVALLAPICWPRVFAPWLESTCFGCVSGVLCGYVLSSLGASPPAGVASWVPLGYAFGFVIGCSNSRGYHRRAEAVRRWIHEQLRRLRGR